MFQKKRTKTEPKTEIELQEPKVYKKRGRETRTQTRCCGRKNTKREVENQKKNYSINPVVYNKNHEEQVILHFVFKTKSIK